MLQQINMLTSMADYIETDPSGRIHFGIKHKIDHRLLFERQYFQV